MLQSDPEELMQFYRDNRKRGKLLIDTMTFRFSWMFSHQDYSYLIFDNIVVGGGRTLFDRLAIIDNLKPTQIWAFEAAWDKIIREQRIWRLHPFLLSLGSFVVLSVLFGLWLNGIKPQNADTLREFSLAPVLISLIAYPWFKYVRQDKFFYTCKRLVALVKQLESEKDLN